MEKRGADRILVAALLATLAVAALAMPKSTIRPFVLKEEHLNGEHKLSVNATELPANETLSYNITMAPLRKETTSFLNTYPFETSPLVSTRNDTFRSAANISDHQDCSTP
ncbi:hypothetical protein O3P69_016573 [Scylla paramamosain]|uniref:Uncharacterized protein n=1 Tax=Scylla paramamosain TaxID=85552 RepID=A0AAW0SX55_SCYPA